MRSSALAASTTRGFHLLAELFQDIRQTVHFSLCIFASFLHVIDALRQDILRGREWNDLSL
jgi:hypothetical protein